MITSVKQFEEGGIEPSGGGPENRWILIRSGAVNSSTSRMTITCSPFRIGRRPDNHLCLDDPAVSGFHGELEIREGRLIIRDLGSTNGTLVNGIPVSPDHPAPLKDGDLLHIGGAMFRARCIVESEERCDTVPADIASAALGQVQFDRLLAGDSMKCLLQPIVRLSDSAVTGYEVLGRSILIGLQSPAQMFEVAAERRQAAELSELLRMQGLGSVTPSGYEYSVNTHPAEVKTGRLHNSLREMRAAFPEHRITIELHELSVPDMEELRELRKLTKELDLRLAYDDFGNGRARLKELIECPPDVLKFDIKLIRGLSDASSQVQATIQSLVSIVRDLNVVSLAEGIESEEEAAACRDLGFELAQGFFFGRGTPPHLTPCGLSQPRSDPAALPE